MALYELYGGDPPKKNSEKVIIKRLLNKKLSADNDQAVDIIRRVAAKTGLSPSFLAANALQEGMNFAIYDDNSEKSEFYLEGNVDERKYPVDGYMYYGLDTFGQTADALKKKGYIPKDFDFKMFKAVNEKKQPIQTAAFKNNEDALLAKSAYLKHFMDQVNEYSEKKNLKLDRNTVNYLTMSAYNGGMGNAKKMIDELASGKYPQKDFVEKGKTSRQGVHKNVEPRMEKMRWIEKMISGPVPSSSPFPMASELVNNLYK